MHSFINILETWLVRLKAELGREVLNAVEWGPGRSTEVLLAAGCEVLSVEHDERYGRKAALAYGEQPRWRMLRKDAAVRNSDYATCVITEMTDPGAVFDVAFVDGRRRVECVLAALCVLRPGGVVMLHDWRRWNYQVLIRSIPGLEILEVRDNTVVLRKALPKVTRKRAAAGRGRKKKVDAEVEAELAEAADVDVDGEEVTGL